MTKSMPMSAIPGRALAAALGIYAFLIAGLALLAAGAASSLSSAKLQGIFHALQSIDSERKELAKLRDAGQVSGYFISAETTKTAQLAKDLGDSAVAMDVPDADKGTRDKAAALAASIVAESERH